MSRSKAKEVTIILFGEPGVGKSLFINLLAYFTNFESFEDATKANPIYIVPQSTTQVPQSYLFSYQNRILHIIDTPGIGNDQEVGEAIKICDKILDHISYLPKIDAICFLLKQSSERQSQVSEFCFNKLLSSIRPKLDKNIFFFFTNSCNRFQELRDGYQKLKESIEENLKFMPQINDSEPFWIEVDVVKFLYALKDGVEFSHYENSKFEINWEESREEMMGFLDMINPPLEDNEEKDEDQTLLLLASKALAEATRTIQIQKHNVNLILKSHPNLEVVISKIHGLQQEQKQIIKAAVYNTAFFKFVNKSSQEPEIDGYIMEFLNSNENLNILEGLCEVSEEYRDQLVEATDLHTEAGFYKTKEEIKSRIQELFNLKYSGEVLKNILGQNQNPGISYPHLLFFDDTGDSEC